VRTRTVVSQTHTSQWFGSCGNPGNGLSRTELRQVLLALGRSLASHHLSQTQVVVRFDGHDGPGAVMADVADCSFVMRGKDDTVLDHPLVHSRLHVPPITSSNDLNASSCAASPTAMMCQSHGLRTEMEHIHPGVPACRREREP
jgi:hypothetical protein